MMSTDSIGIFVATMTGLAELCAEEITTALEGAGLSPTTLMMDNLQADAIEDYATIVIVSSTYGHGDIPDNGQSFYEALEAGGMLTGRNYAVFGLGDRTYMDTFCHAADKWDALLSEKGATRIAPIVRHDASSGTLAEDEAGAWAAGWSTDRKLVA